MSVLYFAHATAPAQNGSVASWLSNTLQQWYVAVLVVSLLALGLIFASLYALVTYTAWRYPQTTKE